jgi:two-component system phosphate regulon sensor histidine kinase PhoR
MRPGWTWLSDALDVPFLVVDSKRDIRHINKHAQALFSLEKKRGKGLVGKSLLAITRNKQLDEIAKKAIRSGQAGPISIIIRSTKDRTFQVRAVSSGSDSASLVALFFSDLTDIEHLRTVRTDFVANVSHELRTPLASIRALAETLNYGAINDPVMSERFLGTIIKEVDRLVRLSEDLLLLTRAESTVRSLGHFDLREVVQDVYDRLASVADRRGVQYKLFLPDTNVFICADYSELDQVVFNLIDNGIKYTSQGGSVHITCAQVGQDATLSVADTGIGMLVEDTERIFERFWRADRARKMVNDQGSTTSGTGLGLSIVKHIVEANMGTITVKSELGIGSTFTVRLPISEPEPYAVDPDPKDE